MPFIVGFIIGSLVTAVAFIVFGKKNKKKIEVARANIIDLYNKAEGEVKEALSKAKSYMD